MTERELLVSTAQHYTSLNRCKNSDTGKCSYYAEDPTQSQGCAIGRWMKREDAKQLEDYINDSEYEDGDILYLLRDINIDKSIFPDWMLNMNKMFLREIQALHDNDEHWDKHGLTGEGSLYVNYICRLYNIPDLTQEELKHKD